MKYIEIKLFDISQIATAKFIGKISVENIPQEGDIVFCNDCNWTVSKFYAGLGLFVMPIMGEVNP